MQYCGYFERYVRYRNIHVRDVPFERKHMYHCKGTDMIALWEMFLSRENVNVSSKLQAWMVFKFTNNVFYKYSSERF